MTCDAADVPLRVDDLGALKLNFYGQITVRVEAYLPPSHSLGGGLGGVHLRVMALEMSADSPYGMVIITTPNIESTPFSSLEIIGALPPIYRQTLFLDFTVTISKPPGGRPPLVLSNTQTAVLIKDNLTQFPPVGAVYQLQEPVDLAPVGNPNQVVGKLQQFPVTLTHIP
jgi:hypothetical protein